MAKFKKYGHDIVIAVGGEELRLKRVKTEKLQKLLNFGKDEENMLINLVDYFTDIISSNYPEEEKLDVEAFVQENALDIFQEFQIAYKLVKREDLEKRKAELLKDGSNK